MFWITSQDLRYLCVSFFFLGSVGVHAYWHVCVCVCVYLFFVHICLSICQKMPQDFNMAGWRGFIYLCVIIMISFAIIFSSAKFRQEHVPQCFSSLDHPGTVNPLPQAGVQETLIGTKCSWLATSRKGFGCDYFLQWFLGFLLWFCLSKNSLCFILLILFALSSLFLRGTNVVTLLKEVRGRWWYVYVLNQKMYTVSYWYRRPNIALCVGVWYSNARP